MKRATLVVLVFLSAIADVAWAGPAEEIAAVAQRRARALAEGNLDVFIADFAEDAVLTSTLVGFRIQGKPAIRAYYVDFIQNYPQRRVLGQPAVTRVYANETIAVVNGYADLTLVDRNGHILSYPIRASTVWVKIDGRWQIVDQHLSSMPGAR